MFQPFHTARAYGKFHMTTATPAQFAFLPMKATLVRIVPPQGRPRYDVCGGLPADREQATLLGDIAATLARMDARVEAIELELT